MFPENLYRMSNTFSDDLCLNDFFKPKLNLNISTRSIKLIHQFLQDTQEQTQACQFQQRNASIFPSLFTAIARLHNTRTKLRYSLIRC